MLNKLRGFSNSKLAMVVVGIIIIPFVFWGMGSVFSGGNTNNVAKINNEPISAKDFIDHINQSKLNNEIIRANIDKDILEKILSELVSKKIVEMEIEAYGVTLSETSLANKIKSNINFLDDKNVFSRLKYEKFLLENSISAPSFEMRFKEQELKRNLFRYIGGGIKSPHFLKNKFFINEQKKIELEYLDLDIVYNNNPSNLEITNFIEENKELLKEDYIDFSYTKIYPKDLVEIDDFSEEFFKKIDEIENNILNGLSINQIKNTYNLNLISHKNYKKDESNEEILNLIYASRKKDKIQLLDKNDYFLLFEITKIDKILPDKSDKNFIKTVKENLVLKNKYEFNKDLYKKIEEKNFSDNEFTKIAINNENIQNIKLQNINDTDKFDDESVKLIYSLPKNAFVLITGTNNKIYLAKLKNIYFNNLEKNNLKIMDYSTKTDNVLIGDVYSSYDLFLNSKYKVKVFKETLDRVKNYFR